VVLVGLKPDLNDEPNALILLVAPAKTIHKMSYNVSSGTLSLCLPTHSLYLYVCLIVYRAADEYIVRHFCKYVGHGSSCLSVLRVYDPDRRTGTVSEAVKRCCLLSADNASFISPTRSDVIQHKIIVTTLVTSLTLTRLGVRGLFTHIFIDEAAQVNFLIVTDFLLGYKGT